MRGGIGRMLIQLAGPGLERPGSTLGSDPGLGSRSDSWRRARRPDRRRTPQLPQGRGNSMTQGESALADESSALAVRAVDVGKVPSDQGGRRRRTDAVELDGGCGRVRLAHRAVGLRQVHAAASHRRPRLGDPPDRRDLRQARPPGTHRPGLRHRVPAAGLSPWRTVAANIALPLELHGVDRTTRAARVTDSSELVGLSDFVDRYPDQLSGGMQQRVAIARALPSDPACC